MKMLPLPWNQSTRDQYIPLRDQNTWRDVTGRLSLAIQLLLVGTLCLVSLGLGFILRGWVDFRLEVQPLVRSGPTLPPSLRPIGTVVRVFEYDEIYSSPPSEKSNRAWENDLPRGKGFMLQHSQLSNISEFSVFHQLHCVDTIRHGYYAAIRNKTHSAQGEAKTVRNHHHVQHCFDFLRQCIQCAADTNVEPVDWGAGGVTGWGFKRMCRDFDSLKRHVEDWKVPGVE